MKIRTALVVVLLSLGAVAQADVLNYNVADDFSLAANPNGAWTYGKYTGGVDAATFAAFNNSGTNTGIAAGLQWWNSGPSDPCTTYNPTDDVITDLDGGSHAWGNIAWAPHTVALSPANGPSVVRWTAPEAGTVVWSASAMGIQEVNTPANIYIIHNTTTLDSAGPVGYNELTSLSGSSLTVAAGDKIDFVISGDKLTQLGASIALTTVPEPSTCALLVSSLLGLLCYAWRKHK
jgi:hypothetical protein